MKDNYEKRHEIRLIDIIIFFNLYASFMIIN